MTNRSVLPRILSIVLPLGGGASLLAVHATADAHITGGAGGAPGWCSPHNATQSGGGTKFSGCVWNLTYDGDGEPWQETFYRNITCAVGTACANALCPAGKAVTGGHTTQAVTYGTAQETNSAYKHGVPTVISLVCQ